MCGRFTMALSMDELKAFLGLKETPGQVPERYNIAPTQSVAVVLNDGQKKLDMLRWGLIPPWAKDPGIGSRLINARAETIAEKPAFKNALNKRRCLILADGFYEWKQEGGRKMPMHIRLKGGGGMAFAGLWETWKAPTGEPIRTCTIITTESNEIIRPFHQRMPVILPKESHHLWLAPGVKELAELQTLLKSYPADQMEIIEVSPLVNSVKNDGPELLEPREEKLL